MHTSAVTSLEGRRLAEVVSDEFQSVLSPFPIWFMVYLLRTRGFGVLIFI